MAVGESFRIDTAAPYKSYAKGKALDNGVATLAAAGSAGSDVVTAGFATLVVFWRIGNATTPATAAADVNGFVNPYEDDGTTLVPVGLIPDLSIVADTLSGNVAYRGRRYSVGGLDKVAIRLINNNAGALQGATASYYLQR